MAYPKNVERWRSTALAELSKFQIPLPVELILSVIERESAGIAGDVNQKSGASGLMQIMPIALTDYNQRHGTKYTMADMRGDDPLSAQRQVEVGVATVGHFWRSAYRYLSDRYGSQSAVPIEELARIADLFFAAGPGATQNRLDKISAPFWENVQKAYPTWNALPHPRHVLKEPKPWNLPAIQAWLDASHPKKKTTT
jgi:hypothetical protein